MDDMEKRGYPALPWGQRGERSTHYCGLPGATLSQGHQDTRIVCSRVRAIPGVPISISSVQTVSSRLPELDDMPVRRMSLLFSGLGVFSEAAVDRFPECVLLRPHGTIGSL
jgi:hypothetical protein